VSTVFCRIHNNLSQLFKTVHMQYKIILKLQFIFHIIYSKWSKIPLFSSVTNFRARPCFSLSRLSISSYCLRPHTAIMFPGPAWNWLFTFRHGRLLSYRHWFLVVAELQVDQSSIVRKPTTGKSVSHMKEALNNNCK
jgi:hypothetical protein